MLKHAGKTTPLKIKKKTQAFHSMSLGPLRAAFRWLDFTFTATPASCFDFSSKELSLDLEPKQRTAADQDGLPFNPGVAPGGAIFTKIDWLRDSESENLLGFSCFFLQFFFGCLVPSLHLCHQFLQSSTMIAIRFVYVEFVNVPTPSPKLTTSCNSNWVMLLGICSFPWRWCPEVLYLC